MPSKHELSILLAITLLAIASITVTIPQASATAKVDITFTANGYGTASGTLITVNDGSQSYTYSAGGSLKLSLKPGDTCTVTAASPLTGYDSHIYTFSSWTNGNGLVTASGTFTVPACSTTVTANYAKTTVNVCFRTSGLTKLNSGDTVLTIDGATYDYFDVQNTNFIWAKGSTHGITAVSSITGWDNVKHDFSSWTSGNGLTANTGTFTTPTSDVTVTANYALSTTSNYHASFAASGFPDTGNNIIKIDGETIAYGDLSGKSYLWAAGSTHTIEALGPVYDYSTPAKGYIFSSWTNGNGLVTSSGTFTMPAHDVTVTANYVQSTVQVTFATSGLANMNAEVTILTVDGVGYDYWGIQNFKAQWTKGSTHSVTAVSSVTGWDNVKRDFGSWTNGNGLTSNTGTFTTPTSNVAVTLNYVTSTGSAAATSITVSCTNSTTPDAVLISGTLKSGSCGLSGKTVTLTYYDGATWHSIGQTTTTSNGAYSYTWTVPAELAAGTYPLKASFAGDSCYQACSANGSLTFYGVHLQVLPESWGSIVALFACFGGAVVFVKLRKKQGHSA